MTGSCNTIPHGWSISAWWQHWSVVVSAAAASVASSPAATVPCVDGGQ